MTRSPKGYKYVAWSVQSIFFGVPTAAGNTLFNEQNTSTNK